MRLAPRILLAATLIAPGCADAGNVDPVPTGTRAVMLGTGTPNADPDRSGPSVAIIANDHAYLVDAGPGIVRRAAAAALAGQPALEASRLDIVFITHLHSDHTVGLPDLLFTPWVLERTAPLRVYGPPGTKAMLEHIHAAWEEDIRARIDGLEPANVTGHAIEVHEMQAGDTYEDANVRVRAIAMSHGAWEHAWGYRFETADRTIFVSGDTGPTEAVVSACDGCDLLIHEVYSTQGFSRRPPEWQRYHLDAHTSTTALADLATRARAGRLVLYHQLFWGVTDEDLVREMRDAGYVGTVVSARDLVVY